MNHLAIFAILGVIILLILLEYAGKRISAKSAEKQRKAGHQYATAQLARGIALENVLDEISYHHYTSFDSGMSDAAAEHVAAMARQK